LYLKAVSSSKYWLSESVQSNPISSDYFCNCGTLSDFQPT
jgi:hypothetical protein